jgi:acetyl-CoA acyltransferase
MKDDVWVVGVGMTPFGVHERHGVADLMASAVGMALRDGELEQRDIEAAFFGCTSQGPLEGQLMIGGQIALRGMGFERLPIVNVENACATGSTALHLAVNYVRAGAADVALAVGVEKMNVGDRASTMAIFDGGYDVRDPGALRDWLLTLGGADGEAGDRSIFMDIYAAWAQGHMEKFGTTQRQIATVAAKNHAHAVDNDKAHFRKNMTVDEVLAGRPLAYPLTVPMCAPVTDGAAAVVVCSSKALARLGGRRAIRVLASVIGTGTSRDHADYERHITRLLAHRAFEAAGLGPQDVEVAEVHDATAFGEILQTELLGLCELGDGGRLAEEGVTSLGGRLPVNPSGGLESKGHPLAATGLGQVYELVTQLRGEAGLRQVHAARIALAENGGGFYAGEESVAVITVLGA